MGRRNPGHLLAVFLALPAATLGGPLLDDEQTSPPTTPPEADGGWMEQWEAWMRRRKAPDVPGRVDAPAPRIPRVAPRPEDPDARERDRAARDIESRIERGKWEEAETALAQYALAHPQDSERVESLRHRLQTERAVARDRETRGISFEEARVIAAILNFRTGGSADFAEESLRRFASTRPAETERIESLSTLLDTARHFRTNADALLRSAAGLLKEGHVEAAGDRCRLVLHECPSHREALSLAARIGSQRAVRGATAPSPPSPIPPAAAGRQTPDAERAAPEPPEERLRRAELLARAGLLGDARALLAVLLKEELPEPLAARARDLAARIEPPR